MEGELVQLYTWVEVDPEGGEATIVAAVPKVGMVNLVTRDAEMAMGPLKKLAEIHRKASGHRVRLLRWHVFEEMGVLD